MLQVLVVFHLLIAIALVGSVLVQRSEGGGLGMGGGGGGMGGFMTGRSTANFLTRVTAGLAACFMATSILLAILSGGGRESGSVMDRPVPAIEEPAPPETPSAPLAD
ncbi:MAG: preprotein translocase subunit SecG [Rhodospirillales bacterium]|nr:preprotein translocase subunit SecG [Rhodospirillales bacterium]